MNEIKPILELAKKGKNQIVFDNLKNDWVTNIWYEKLALSACILWTCFSIVKFAWGMLR